MMKSKTPISLACMKAGCSGVVNDIQGGHGIINNLKSRGITSGKRITRITPVTVQGPITIEIDKNRLRHGFTNYG